MPTGADDGTATYNDGRVGTALIQEYRFSKYCERIQNILQPYLDKEFKMFLKHRGIEVPSSLFDLKFVESQSFSQYRDIEIESQRAQLFGQVEGVDYMSRRFIMKKYLGLTEDELRENEQMWKEENTEKSDSGFDAASELGGLGVRSGDVEGFEPTDVDAEEDSGDDMSDMDSPVGSGTETGDEANEI